MSNAFLDHSEPPKVRSYNVGMQYDDGYDWMEAMEVSGAAALSGWGLDGWDCGSWPLVVICIRKNENHTYTTLEYCEGDVVETDHDTRDKAVAAIDAFAEFNWRIGQADGPDDLDKYPKGELP